MFHIIQGLMDLGCTVTFAAERRWDTPGIDQHVAAGRRFLLDAGSTVVEDALDIGWWRTHGMEFDVILLSFVQVASSQLAHARKWAAHATIIFDTVDLGYMRMFRMAQTRNSIPALRAALTEKTLTLSAAAQADIALVVSTVEVDLLRRDCPTARVMLLSNLHAVPPTVEIIRVCLRYIATTFEAEIPARVLAVLEAAPIPAQRLPRFLPGLFFR